ncbi:replication initiator [Actinoallomurus sp. CA-142502]|uniref:replication initiator n=1 Tax=Actinoallomurus sp. CA-142502 TaxID=3239885 RepID=UPI003D949039
MPNPLTRHAINGMVARYNDPHYDRWAAQIRRTGGCAQPVHLRGKVEYRDPLNGTLLHRYTTTNEPGGVVRVACKTRRASRCPSCAETYRADTYQLIRAGLVGGKGVPAEVAEHPAVFLTLTAPSFGAVHSLCMKNGQVLRCRPRRKSGTCPHGRPVACNERHSADDPRLGKPICPDCYDHTGSVLFNALAPELWRRFTIRLRRVLARNCGLSVKELGQVLKVSFAKVAEYQRRGVVHFHAIVRLDGPNGPTTQPPGWATLDGLAEAITEAARHVTVATPEAAELPSVTLAWGRELDIRPITANGDLTEQAVAGYVAKYATKAAECVGTLDRRVRPTDDLDQLDIRPHARRLIAECLRLGALPELEDLRLTAWAHMLGFRGHFSTKSRAYSTTLATLRAARAEYQRAEHPVTTGRLPFDDDTVLVTSHWAYVGQGLTTGEALLAAAITATRLPVTAPPEGLAA